MRSARVFVGLWFGLAVGAAFAFDDADRDRLVAENQCVGCDLRAVNLSGADLAGANLWRARLYSADLSGADLRGANLRGADLRRANLAGANLSGANLKHADLSEANLRDARMVKANLFAARLNRADLRGADVRGAYLGQAKLRGADLTGATSGQTYLADANLAAANLTDLDLTTATLRNARLDGAILCRTLTAWGEESGDCEDPSARNRTRRSSGGSSSDRGGRARSWPCVPPGSSGQKIAFHRELADLGVEIVDLPVVVQRAFSAPLENTALSPSIAWRFHVLNWFGCTLCLAAISWIVLSPRSASSATLALKSAVNRRRLVIFALRYPVEYTLPTCPIFSQFRLGLMGQIGG